MVNTIWTPPGAVQLPPVLIGQGHKTLDGKWIFNRKIVFTNPRNNRTQDCCILDNEMSDDALASSVGIAYENFIRDTDDLPAKPVFSVKRRQEIGRAIREIREHKAKRLESSNGQIYYDVAKVG